MANKLGAAFLRCALGPINYAGGLILSTKVGEGLAELSVDNLHGGLKRGVEEAAKQVGVPVADVERLLPMASVVAAAARLDHAQKNAASAWGMYAGQLGGLLKGVADLTVDGRAPDVSHFLERLSRKVVRDRPLSEPLRALSVEVAAWLDIVEHCAELLGDGGVLAKAYRARRVRRVILAASLGALFAVVLAVIGWIQIVRGRVEAALTAADPCAVMKIEPGDLSRASSEQQKREAERRASCEDRRRKEEQAREEQRRKEEQARESERAKKERRERCDALAGRLEGGADLNAEDEALTPAQAPLLRRIAKRALDRGDLTVTSLPCEGTPAAPKITAAFAAALVASPAAWARADDVSPRVSALLAERKAELTISARNQLAAHADAMAKRALIFKDASLADRATRVCKLKDDVDARGAKYCATLSAVRAMGKL